MNSICPEEEKLSAYMDGELAEGELLYLEGHIACCDHCRHRLEALRQLEVAFRPMATAQLPLDLAAYLQGRLGEAGCPDEAAIYGWRPWKLIPLSLTAALMLSFGGLLGTALIVEEPPHTHPTALWMAPFEPMTDNICIGSSTCYRKG